MTNKTTLKRLKLDPYFSKTIETNLNVWSHDQNSYEIKFEFYDHQCNKPIDLTGADMRILLDHADSKPKIYPLEIESKVLGLAKFIMPEQIRSCEGKFTAHIYADYPNRTHDFGSFTFYTKLSRLDGNLGGCMDEIYVSEFEKALEDIKEFKVDIDKNINDMKEHFDGRYDKANVEIEELENKINEKDIAKKTYVTEMISGINKDSLFIDVTNPPISTGLDPYSDKNSDEENTKNIQKIFEYIKSREVNYKDTDMSLYTGYTYTVFFPKNIYTLTNTIDLKGNYLHLKGDRAIIKTTHEDVVFNTTGSQGWNLNIEGFTFDRTSTAIKQNNDNLEAGYTNIRECWFIDTTGTAIDIKKQSSIGVIEHCKFHKCEYVLTVEKVDRMHFNYNWVSEKPRTKNRDASIIAKSMRLIMESNLFVPYRPVDGVVETAYVNAYATVQARKNHFGAEPGNKTVINVFKSDDVFKPSGGRPYIVEVSDSTDISCHLGYTVIRLFSLPNRVKITNNSGLYDDTSLIKWGSGVDEEKELAEYDKRKHFVNIDINSNIGAQINFNSKINLLPDNLKPFLTDFTSQTHYQSGLNNKYKKITKGDTKFFLEKVNTNKTYLVNVNVSPHSGGNYNSVATLLISFKSYYDNVYKKEIITTVLQDLPGGPPPISDSCKVSVLFIDSNSNIINTQSKYQDIVIEYGDRIIEGEIMIKELFEGIKK